ncbi:unnamed protein product [Paramecium sonneborni]|uniref:Transmembrane protein n=1 Tax=Paramecium sonneborni TaxID=65129 RepID=A0A8S1Q6L6_9CILI|nr:unnamed protein product [Paramecium sonneborni]
MLKRMYQQISQLLNGEILQINQQRSQIVIFRIIQLSQYFSIIMPSYKNKLDSFHFTSLITILKTSLLDYDSIPIFLGYISSAISITILIYILILSCLNIKQIAIVKKIILIYVGLLPQYFCYLQISITSHTLLKLENNLFEQMLGTITIIIIFIQSFLSLLFMRNTYFSQTILCRDLTIIGLISQIMKFMTILFYFYNIDSNNTLYIITLICALLWTISEVADILYYFPYCLSDNQFQFCLNSIKIISTIMMILDASIEFEQAVIIYQLILSVLGYYASRQVFRVFLYNNCFNLFSKAISKDQQSLYLKIILFLKDQQKEQRNIYQSFLSCNVLNLHKKYCEQNCQVIIYFNKAQVYTNILECLISKIFQNEEESLFLYKISYIAFIKKQYSLSLMKIKQYQIFNGHTQTWYFKLMVLDITKNIEREIQQVLYNSNIAQNWNRYTYLTSKDLVEFEQQEIELMPMIEQLINKKIDIWQSQIRGFKNIYDLQYKLINFAKLIDQIRKQLSNIFEKDINDISISLINNIYHLRILSLYYSLIVNDQLNSYLCEKQIQVVYYFEQTLKQNELTSLALITDKISVVAVSLVKKQGEILNKNKQKIGSLFGYHKSNEYNALLSVNQIIPDFIGSIHNEMLTEFLKKGQSSFFVQFKTVFGKNKDYFIMPLQLKFSNDFNFVDDFVIKGVMYQGQKQQDFILFDDQGHIQGITKQFYEILIRDNYKSYKIDLEQLTKQMYIYYFMPEIFNIIQEYQQQKQHNQLVQFLEDTQFIVIQNLMEFHEDFSRSIKKFTRHTVTDPALYASSYTNCSELTNNNVKTMMRRRMYTEIDRNLINQDFAKSAIKFIYNNLDNYVTYFIKFQLQYYPIQNEKVKGFYILEIIDYRKNYDKKVGSEAVFKDVESQMKQSIKIQSQFIQRVQNQIEFEEINVCQVAKSNTITTDNIRLDTNGNTSKRVIFLKPEIQSQLNDFAGVEKSESSSEEKQEDYFSPPQSNRLQFCKENDSIQPNQQSVKNQKRNISEMEMAINQSQSSGVSRQSSRTSTYFNNLFLNKIRYTNNIKAIIFICILTVTINLFLCIFNSIKLYSGYQNFQTITTNMKVPMNLNRYYSKTATLAWISICSNYSILNISQFQKNQNQYQLNQINQFILGNVSLIYPSLIETEEQIPYINQSLGLYHYEEVTLTQFIDYMNFFTKQILVNKDINTDYIEAMIILRYNVKNMRNITIQIMDQLETQFELERDFQLSNQLIAIITNSLLMLLLYTVQFIFCLKIQIQNQTLSLLVGRVKEQEIMNEIVKTQYLLQSLKNIAGEDSWKRINFWSYIFQNDYDNVYKARLIQNKTNRTSNLNSRIKHIRIRFKFELLKLIIFLIIYLCFIWGLQILYSTQTEQMTPIVELEAQYVKFSVNIDILVFSGLIIKSQPQLYQNFIDNKIFSEKQINLFDDDNQIIELFNSLQTTFSLTMKSLFNDVISTLPSSDDVSNLKKLIDSDVCLVLYNEIPFCQFYNISQVEFINKYGQFYEYDNDLDYLKSGILGIMAKQASFYQQNYGYEIENVNFNPNQNEINSVYNAIEFHQIILSHFKDSYLCFVKFLALLTKNISDIRYSDFIILLLYIYIAGLLYFILYIIFYYFWIKKSNKYIRSLKLSLVVIPNEQLFNSSIINILRKFD